MATTMMEKRGTCPACMGEFQLGLVNGNVVVGKHGWREVGGRRVGVYGVAAHTGECFGVGHPPFELSPSGTWAYLKEVLFFRCLGHLGYLARLATFPVLRVEEKVGVWIELTPENEAGSKVEYPFAATTRYERERLNRVDHTKAIYRADFEEGQTLTQLALAWKLADIKDAPPKGPTVHFKNGDARLPYCGSRSYGLTTTMVEAEVTCSRCAKALEADAKRAEVRKQIAEDAGAMIELLKAGGPKTKAEIKKELGWDTKRLNAALDRADRDRRVQSIWRDTKPDHYQAI